MIRLGLTGSIGMGKSTTAELFEEAGCAIWDADKAVHRLYDKDGAAVLPIQNLFPQAIENKRISRAKLRKIIAQDEAALPKIEAVVHPLVAQDRAEYAAATDNQIIVFDIPLLFENSLEHEFDKTVCVSVNPETQKSRVMARQSMSEEDLDRILSFQMPDEEKRRKADYVVTTDTVESARAQVRQILSDIKTEFANA